MQPGQGAIVLPAHEVSVDRAAGRQVFWQGRPLAAGAQDIHQRVDDLAHVDCALVATSLGRRDQGLDQRPLRVRQVARVAQLAAVIPTAVLCRPHAQALASWSKPNKTTTNSRNTICS